MTAHGSDRDRAECFDHELALALWDTGNFDARNLAVKIADPARMSPADLDRWAQAPTVRMCSGYVAHLAVEGPHARAKADQWLAAPADAQWCVAWRLVGAMAMLDEGERSGVGSRRTR